MIHVNFKYPLITLSEDTSWENIYWVYCAGKQNWWHPRLHFRDTCKRDMKELDINLEKLRWNSNFQVDLRFGVKIIITAFDNMRKPRKNWKLSVSYYHLQFQVFSCSFDIASCFPSNLPHTFFLDFVINWLDPWPKRNILNKLKLLLNILSPFKN